MSEIQILKVDSSDLLRQFITFPMQLYKNNSYFVPPILEEEKKTWNPKYNPAFDYSHSENYLALRNKEVIGRIALIINYKEAEELNIEKIRFGWFDFIDDYKVSQLLFHKAIELAQEKNIKLIEGPMGFTNLDKSGALVHGFNEIATIIGLYNYPYYINHFEKLGLTKEKEWVEFEIEFPDKISDKVEKFNKIIKEKYDLNVLQFSSKEDILPYVDSMFKLLDETYKHLSSYTPISNEQIQTYKEKYFKYINKDFIVCITNKHSDLIAFAITMPSYSTALQKAKGKILPWGWWHILQASRKNDRANFYLIGVHPEYQNKGVTSIIFKEIYSIFKKKGVRFLETNPELEENKSIQLLWQNYHPRNHKRRRTYSLKF